MDLDSIHLEFKNNNINLLYTQEKIQKYIKYNYSIKDGLKLDINLYYTKEVAN